MLEFITYDDPSHGIKIQYPNNWKYYTSMVKPLLVTLQPPTLYENVISLKYNQEKSHHVNSDSIRYDIFNFIIHYLKNQTSGLTLTIWKIPVNNEYIESYTQTRIEKIKKSLQDFYLIDCKACFISSNKGYKALYTYSENRYKKKVLHIWLIHNNNSYELIYLSNISDFSKYQDIAYLIMESFQISTYL